MAETYNPFVQIGKAFEGFVHSEVYYRLRRQSTASKLLCAVIVTLILNLITFGISTLKLVSDKDISNFINDMPDFSYSNSTFTLAKRYETKTSDTYVIIDTDVSYYYSGSGDSSGYIDPVNVDSLVRQLSDQSGMQQAMFVSQSNMVMVNFLTGQVQTMKFSELSSIMHIPDFSKASIQTGYKGFIAKWAAIFGVMSIPFVYAGLFLTTLIYSLLALIGKAITKSNDDFNTVYWIAFYINLAISICKALVKNTVPFAGSMLNTLLFALFIFLILKTLKNGDPDARAASDRYISPASVYPNGSGTSAFGDYTQAEGQTPYGVYNANTNTNNTMQDTSYSNSPWDTAPQGNSDTSYSSSDQTTSSSGLSLKNDD